MAVDCNIYGGFVSGGSSTEAVWGDIKGTIENQTDLIEKLNAKMDKQEDKGLSTNDFTDEAKDKLDKLNNTFIFSLLPNQWESTGQDDTYVQRGDFDFIDATDNVTAYILLSDDTELANKESLYWEKLEKIVTNDGYLSAYINGEIPDITLNIKIKI